MWICWRGEEGGTKSVERTWQLLFCLSLHCFGPSQILFHGAKHTFPGISTAPISRRRFKPLSWQPRWACSWEPCDAHQHRQRQKHTYYIYAELYLASWGMRAAYSHVSVWKLRLLLVTFDVRGTNTHIQRFTHSHTPILIHSRNNKSAWYNCWSLVYSVTVG